MKKRLTGICLLFATAIASAHGGSENATKAFDPAQAEQKEFGIAGDPANVTKTIQLSMTDKMRFTPDKLNVKQGDTVKFVITNKGKMLHEMVVGTKKELQEHAKMMQKFPDMEHDEPYMAHVKPGKTEEMVWTFNQPGTFDYACLIAGHFQAGMTGKIVVTRK
jgi:uncharacterized cupredoxin-like copper-binding protein